MSRVAAGTSILIIVIIILANGTGVYKVICHCFGELMLLKTPDALLMDVLIMGMVLLILVYGGGFLSLGLLIKPLRKSASPNSGLVKDPR